MRNKLIKVLPYIFGALVGLILGLNGLYIDIQSLLITTISIVLVAVVEIFVFAIIHELSHGFTAEKNGLKFTVLYLGPFAFKRENKKFKKIKGLTKQLIYLGRAQIDNFEILNKDDIEKAKKSWIKSLKAGPISDLILSIIVIVLGLIFKSYILIISTALVSLFMCLPSYIMGDGQHIKLMKKDKIFSNVILYTYTIAGNTPVSEESKLFLLGKVENDISNSEANEDNIISLALAAQSLYIDGILKNKIDLPQSMDDIVEKTIKSKNKFLKKQIESSYYRGLINSAIMYEVIINNNKKKAFKLYKYVKKQKHNLPGEKLDFYRVQHILNIADRKGEIENENLMNPIFKGCQGIENIERRINKIILE